MKMKLLHLFTAFVSLLLIGVLVLGLTSFGLPLALSLINAFIPGEIHYLEVKGRLISEIQAKELSYRDQNIHVLIEDLDLKWSGLRFLRGEVDIHDLKASLLRVEQFKPKENPDLQISWDFQKFKAQTPILINHFQIAHLRIRNPDLSVYHLQGTVALNEQGLRLRDLEFTHEHFDMKLQANVGPGFEPPIKLIADQDFSLDGYTQIQGETRLEGNLVLLEGSQTFSDPLKSSLKVSAKNLGPDFQIEAQGMTEIADLDLIDENLYGALHLQLALNYDHARGIGRAQLNTDKSEINGEVLKLKFDGLIQNHQVSWKDSQFIFGKNRLTTSGFYGPEQTQLTYDLQADVYQTLLNTQGQISSPDNQLWMTSIKNLKLLFPDQSQYALNQPTQIHWQKEGILIHPDLCLSSTGQGSICVRNPTESQVHVFFKEIPTQLIASQFTKRFQVTGAWNAQAEVNFEGLHFDHLTMDIKIPPAAFVRGKNNQKILFQIGDSTIHLILDQKQLKSEALFQLIQDDQITLDLQVHDWNDLDLAQLQAEIKGKMTHWDPLRLFITETNDFSGQVDIDLLVKGSVLHPVYGGSMTLSQARLAIPSQGITLEEGLLKLTPSDSQDALRVSGSLKSGEGKLEAEGTLSLKDTWPALDVDLTGDRFMISNTSKAVVYVSPLLRVQTHETLIELSGELHIPEASLNVKGYQSYLAPSPDIVILQEQPEVFQPIFEVDSRVLFSLGDKIALKAGNLQTGIGGHLNLVRIGASPLRATGQLFAVDGKYSAYGKKLDLSQAVLTFNNSLIDNPALFIEASRKVQITQTQNAAYLFADPSSNNKTSLLEGTVGLRITGTVQNPKYTFYSNPPMSEADQLSYLMTGTSASQIGSAQAAFMFAALTEGSGVLGVSDTDAARLQNIIRAIGIDFNIESSNRIDQATGQAVPGTNFVVGKALLPKLYVSYAVGLLDPLNVFRVRYQLSPHWAVQTQANTQGDTGGDILYGVESDKFLGID